MSDGPQTFTNWLIEQRGGALHGELTERLAEVVGAVREHAKAGSLTVKISVKPSGDGSMVQVSDDVTVAVPQADRGASLFFTTGEGGLSRRNPDQPELPLRDASRPPAAIGQGSVAYTVNKGDVS